MTKDECDERLSEAVFKLKQVLKVKYKMLFLTPQDNLAINNDLASFMIDVQNIMVNRIMVNQIILDRPKIQKIIDKSGEITGTIPDIADEIKHIKERYYNTMEVKDA